MKKITRKVNHFDTWTNSWFTDTVTEYEFVTKIYQWIASMLPKRLLYLCYIHFMAYVTTHGEGSKLSPDEITFSKAVEIWENYNY
jgi:hypothetical protein